MEDSLKPRDDIQHLVDMFEESEEFLADSNNLAARCRNYYDGDQLSETELAELSRRGQPAIVSNHIRKEINWMLGYELQNRIDPRAFPRTPSAQDEGLAGIATEALRYVADQTKYDKIRSKEWEKLLVEGVCDVEVVHTV